MTPHDVSAYESAVRAVQTVEVVIVLDHILLERIQAMSVGHRVSAAYEVPLHHEATVAVQ